MIHLSVLSVERDPFLLILVGLSVLLQAMWRDIKRRAHPYRSTAQDSNTPVASTGSTLAGSHTYCRQRHQTKPIMEQNNSSVVVGSARDGLPLSTGDGAAGERVGKSPLPTERKKGRNACLLACLLACLAARNGRDCEKWRRRAPRIGSSDKFTGPSQAVRPSGSQPARHVS